MAAVRLAAAVLLGVAVVPHAASKTNRTEPKLALGNSCPGVCQSSTVHCASAYLSGLCPGGASIRCCREATPKCDSVGGQCQQTSLPCAAGTYAKNLCPGAASVQCCHGSAPNTTAPFGPDVSHYQGAVNWPAIKSAGVGFAIAKATEGTTYVDTQFKANWQGMGKAGIRVRGAYHFGHPNADAVAQAHHFVSTVGTLAKGDFVVLDIESSDKVAPAKVATWSKLYVQTVSELLGLPKSRVWVYTGAWFWTPQAAGSSLLSDHPLWVSGYVSGAPPMPKGWSSWTMWQYTDKGKIAGINGGVDTSRYHGTQRQLEALVGL